MGLHSLCTLMPEKCDAICVNKGLTLITSKPPMVFVRKDSNAFLCIDLISDSCDGKIAEDVHLPSLSTSINHPQVYCIYRMLSVELSSGRLNEYHFTNLPKDKYMTYTQRPEAYSTIK